MTLSLIKSGTHPDPRGDKGTHHFTYALLPHKGSFSAETVIRPAYELNVKPVAFNGGNPGAAPASLLIVDQSNVLVESIKWAETKHAFVVRLYEAEKSLAHTRITFGRPVAKVERTNLLEENPVALALEGNSVAVTVKPFEVVTLVVTPI
jgi:alpha-mannosidase